MQWIWRVGVCAALAAGCGDDGSAQASSTLAALSESDVTALCEELQDSLQRVWNGLCTQEGIESQARGGPSCGATRDLCLKQSAGGSCQARTALQSENKSCGRVRVADLRDCLESAATRNEQRYGKGVTCSSGLHPAANLASSGPPASCLRIEALCPSVMSNAPASADDEDEEVPSNAGYALDQGGGLTEFVFPDNHGLYIWDIASDGRGGAWVTAGDGLTHIDAKLAITTFRAPADYIAVAPDQTVWFTTYKSDRVGRLTPSGKVEFFPIPTPASGAAAITIGPDNNAWFVEQTVRKVARVTPAGDVTEFALPGSRPTSLVSGTNGKLWVVANGLYGVSSDGMIEPLPGATSAESERSIALAPDGSAWLLQVAFVGPADARIRHLDAKGKESVIRTPLSPHYIAAAPDGSLYFTEFMSGSNVGRVDPAGNVSEVRAIEGGIHGITVATDGAVWLSGSGSVWRLAQPAL